MSVHPELAFEKKGCEVLGSHGWLYDDGAAAHYDRKLALYPPDLIAWLQEPQADAWATYQQRNGSTAEANPLQRVREQLDQQGTLDLLCNGIEVMQLFSGVGSSKPRTAVDMRQLRERSSARNRRARGNSTGSGSNRLRSLDKR